MQRNKRVFFIFICLGTSSSFLGAVIAVQSMCGACHQLVFSLSWVPQLRKIIHLFVHLHILAFWTGIWNAPIVLRPNETWMRYLLFQHPGVVIFLLMDLIIMIGCTTLTTVQASQVCSRVSNDGLMEKQEISFKLFIELNCIPLFSYQN